MIESFKSPSSTPIKLKKDIYMMIRDDCEDDAFDRIYLKLEGALSENDILKILNDQIGKKKTKEIGPKIVEMLGKNISASPAERMCYELREKGLQAAEVQRFKNLFITGQKYAFQSALIKYFGKQFLPIYQKYQKSILEKIKEPISKSKYLTTSKGLKFYEYPQPNLTNNEKNTAKVLMVLGETGSGKSTFLNSLINYLCQVQINDPFRYQIIIENTNDQTKSITKNINTYYVKNQINGKVYKLVDTPGFGDTDGIKSDQNLIKMIEKKFKSQIQSIDCVMFVIKSSNVRLNHYQRYIFQSVLDLFGKDVAENFCFILTFSDAGDPPVLPSLKDEQQGFGRYWNKVPNPKYIPVNNGVFFQAIDMQDVIMHKYWEIGIQSMSRLLNRVDKCKSTSLTLTKQMIKKKEMLSNQLKATREKIQDLMAIQLTIKKQINDISIYEKEIDGTKNFQFYTDKPEYYPQYTSNNVTRCNNCLNTNCHDNCSYGDNVTKKDCCAMDSQGNCTVCPGRCSYIAHVNDHYLRKLRNVKQKQTSTALKARYDKSLEGKNATVKILEAKIKQFISAFNQTNAAYEQMFLLNKELQKIALTNKKSESFIEYMQIQIKNQKQFKTQGWQERVKQLNLFLKEANINQSFVKGNEKISKETILKDLKDERINDLLKNASPDLFQKLKSLLK